MIAADRVLSVARGTWKLEDARERVRETRVVGRARVQLEVPAGSASIATAELVSIGERTCVIVVDALVVASQRIRDLGDKFAVFFHPEDGRLVALPMEGQS